MRGLTTEPPAGVMERVRPLAFFINNLAPGLRAGWITLTNRHRVDQFTIDDIPRLSSDDHVSGATRHEAPHAVVLNHHRVLLGSLDDGVGEGRAIDYVNGGPQTIRPDMKPALAKKLLREHAYLLVTTTMGEYLGRYIPPLE